VLFGHLVLFWEPFAAWSNRFGVRAIPGPAEIG
jgi:hypothetical protein